MRHTLALAVLLASAAAVAAYAQGARSAQDKAVYISGEQLQHLLQVAPSTDGKPADFSGKVFNGPNSSTAFIRLSGPDQPHAHGQQSEVFIVTQGSGVLETGGKIVGDISSNSAVHNLALDMDGKPLPKRAGPPPGATDPDDKSGTAIDGGVRQAVKAGDVILIPAKVAHHWLKVDKPVVYFDLKFAAK